MCGIVGYVGFRKSVPVLVGGLEKLEYRGYDSAGISSLIEDKLKVFRAEGKLLNLKKILSDEGLLNLTENEQSSSKVNIGIGHTRWATHGRPSETNAHPHMAGDVCLVHNGIIENYLELRRELVEKGCVFESETDTEIAAHLINLYLKESSSLFEAVKKAVSRFKGSYALVVISKNEKESLVVSKNATPVIIGVGENESFIASDIPAVIDYTKDFIVLEDGDLAEVKPNSIYIEHKGEEVKRESLKVTWDAITAEKGGFRHFMLKEIYEQPRAITDTFRGRIKQQSHKIPLEELNLTDDEIKKFKRIYIVACGTAWHASLVTKFYIESLAKIPVEVDYGSEFRYREPLIDKDTLFIAVSQSGETADTLGSLELAKSRGAKTLAICNVVGSSISRKADCVLYTHAGPEISVASTKAFVTQLVAGYLLSIRLASAKNQIDEKESTNLIEELVHLPSLIKDALTLNDKVEQVSKKYGLSEDFLYLARGFLYPLALEGALKLKEISYVHAEGYPAGEMKHGPIALIGEKTPVVVILGHDDINYEKAMGNLQEVKARGGKIIAVTDTLDNDLKNLADEVISVGEVSKKMLPIALTIPLQLLAYHIAVYRGTDVDQPRNLAKSVTVE